MVGGLVTTRLDSPAKRFHFQKLPSWPPRRYVLAAAAVPDADALKHFVWAAGHLVLLAASLRYVLASLTFKAASSLWYKGPSSDRPRAPNIADSL